MKKPSRSYRQTKRAAAARRTGRRILEAATALWRERALEGLTLQAIAERAGVSVQTVLRRYGSKEGVVEAVLAEGADGVRAQRDTAPVGDLDGALGVLMAHYEQDGEAVLSTLALEDRLEAARLIAGEGRRYHRRWCERVFAPWLPPPGGSAYDLRLDAFVAATDLALWKLLRRDLGRTPEETRATLYALLEGLTKLSP